MTNSERRVQRVRAALEPPGNARDDVRIMVDLAARLGHEWEYGSRRGRLERAALAGAEPRRHELQAARGARRHPVAVLLRGQARADVPARAPVEGAARGPAGRVPRGRGLAADRASSRTSSRCGSRPAAGWTRSTPACRPAATRRRCAAARSSSCRPPTPRQLGVSDGERVRVSSARGSVIAPVRDRAVAAPGAGVHDAALPRRGGDEHPDDQRHRPEVRHRGVQGHRHPRRPDRATATTMQRRWRPRRLSAAQPFR